MPVGERGAIVFILLITLYLAHPTLSASLEHAKDSIKLRLRGAGYYDSQGQDLEPMVLKKKGAEPKPKPKPKTNKEDQPLPKVTHELKIAIMRARQAKGMSQKDLAKALNEQAQVIQRYEAGTAQPSNALIARMDKILGVKLPRVKKPKKKSEDES